MLETMRTPTAAIRVVNPWALRHSGRRMGSAGVLSAAVHLGVGVLLVGLVVRTPEIQQPIRVSLYDPAPPPPAPGQAAVPEPVKPVEPRLVANPVPRSKPVPRIHRRSAPVQQPKAPAAQAEAAPAAASGPADGVAGGVAGGIAGGMVGGTGHMLIPADQAARKPIPISKVMPEYPTVARLRGIEGQVVLEAILAADGRIEPDITVVHSVPLLDAAAITAVRQWRFQPARDEEGHPLRVTFRVPVRFVLR